MLNTARRGLIPLIAALTIAGSISAQPPVLIRNAQIVDVAAGAISPPQSVLIDEGKIAAIGPTLDEPTEPYEALDAAGGYLIPGLWDSHVHIFSTPTEPDTALPLYLINGVTGIRDMGALWPIKDQKALQARIESGEVLGPRIILSGAWVDASPGSWPGMFLADTPDDAERVVTQIKREGWAAVKAYSMLEAPTYRAVADAATKAGLPLVGHIPERVTLDEALEAGQIGMEHFGRVTMACSRGETDMIVAMRDAFARQAALSEVFALMAKRNAIVLETWNADLCASVLARMARAGLHVSPTLVVADFYIGNWPAENAPRMQMIPADIRSTWGKPDFRLDAVTDEVLDVAQDTIALDRRTFQMAHAAGVPILAATDASFANPYLFHGFSLLDELDIYVSAGLTPQQALYTATVAPPIFFGLNDQDGVIAPGRRADLVLVTDNPLEDLGTLRAPVAVVAGGALLDASMLDVMRAELVERAR